MDRQSLSVSPVAELIVKIAEQRESCSLQLADRGLRIVAGELAHVSATEGHARLLREAQAMARLSHRNVVAIHDVGTYEDTTPPLELPGANRTVTPPPELLASTRPPAARF